MRSTSPASADYPGRPRVNRRTPTIRAARPRTGERRLSAPARGAMACRSRRSLRSCLSWSSRSPDSPAFYGPRCGAGFSARTASPSTPGVRCFTIRSFAVRSASRCSSLSYPLLCQWRSPWRLRCWCDGRFPQTRVALTLPVAAPHLVVATLAVLWLAPGGLADRLLPFSTGGLIGAHSGLGVIVVYVAKEAPFLTLLCLAALDTSTEELERTAAMLGATRAQRLRDVLLPGSESLCSPARLRSQRL